MSFWLYSKSGSSYTRVQSIKLTGKNGLLASFLNLNEEAETPFAWELTPQKVIHLIDPTLDADAHVILIDMLPEELFKVSLYRVTSFRGISEYDESDLVLACKMLKQGRTSEPATTFKEAFYYDAEESDRQMVEALRLTGGVASGTYLWGKPKMDIGAAICPSTQATIAHT